MITNETLNMSTAMLPAIVLTAGSLILMLQIAFKRQASLSWGVCLLTLVLAMAALVPAAEVAPVQVTPLLLSDHYSLFFSGLILLAALVTCLLAKGYVLIAESESEEFYLLVLLSTLGALVLVSASHVASLLLGLELLGVALYALIAYPEKGDLPLEGAIKYLVLSGAASAILLFGFALIYAALGSLSFTGIGQQLATTVIGNGAADLEVLVLAGTALVVAGIGFKLSLVPFHLWTPDVYQGAPLPVSSFIATVSKGAVFAALLRFLLQADLYQYDGLMTAISVLAIVSMVIGNLLALKQQNVKRVLAYSSIAHMGYLMISIVLLGAVSSGASSSAAVLATEAGVFYVAAYVVTSLAAFAVLIILSSQQTQELDELKDLKGLFWRQPLLALGLSIALLSLAGIPLTAGFIAKFYLIAAGVTGHLWWLVLALVIGSGIGIYYYLRIVYAMAQSEEGSVAGSDQAQQRVTGLEQTVVVSLIALVIMLGIIPQEIMRFLTTIVV